MSGESAVSAETLRRAVDEGVLTEAQLAALVAMERPRSQGRAEDEAVRLVTSFADIFVTLGIALFVGALAWFTQHPVPIVVAAWLLAEFFTRRRRMALPSIVLLLLFSVASFVALAQLTGATTLDLPRAVDLRAHSGSLILAALLTVGAAGLYYWRFRVPITVAAGAAAASLAVLAAVRGLVPDLSADALLWLVMALGLAVFALAMRFDLSDPLRQTRRADIAFWLHLLAAPMIVHPLVRGLTHGTAPSVSEAVLILALFLALGLVAIVVDRRALLVSGLAYAGYAFGTLIRQTGVSDSAAPATVLTLGAFVLVLSAAWQPLRQGVLALLPGTFTRHLPQGGAGAGRSA